MAHPLPPCRHRARRSDPGYEADGREVVSDALRAELQAQEGVDAGEIAAVGGRAGRVEPAGPAAPAAHLETLGDVEATEGVASAHRVVEQVGEDAVLADVGLEARAVDDDIRFDRAGCA